MTLDDYQQAAARTINQGLDERARLVDAAAGLSEEAGEVLGLVRKHVYMNHALDRDRLTKELGDALWCLAGVAGALGVTLEDVAQSNLAKLRARYPDGYSDDASRAREPRPAPGA
ncbi:MAG TPA: nucleoside triphosphate pyrophosphohydrolase family protein [Gemmatimonadaceae bacterium]|nr:nucleoside triphosphate pyrophosphohydrolase family protein [Gemmatimonadaceae bacterium]